MQVSTVLTIGSALTRAQQDEIEVSVLVQGEWFGGQVMGLDGHGVVLDDGQGHDLIVRLDHVAVLRLEQEKDPWADDEIEAAHPTDAADPVIPFPRAADAPELTV